jgi:ATP-dependent Clp protease ATP-binding subunit ClpB
LKRAIQRELQDSLALKILAGEFREGDVIEVERGKDGLIFSTAVQGEVVEA